ncbi:hypothetical protein V6N11_057229 [Hibiscus sabdariffa]
MRGQGFESFLDDSIAPLEKTVAENIEILTDNCGNREEESNQKVIDVGHVENVADFNFEGSQRDVSDEIVEKLDARAGEIEIGPFGVSSQLSDPVAKNMDKNECIRPWGVPKLLAEIDSFVHGGGCQAWFQPGLERSWNAILQFASYRIEEKGPSNSATLGRHLNAPVASYCGELPP